jgi:hypothetical protein
MPDTNELTREGSRIGHTAHPFGFVALMFWAIAIVCICVDAAYANSRVLILANGVLAIDTAAASLATLMWHINRILGGPVTDWRIGVEYGYRTGYRDGRRACDRSHPSGGHLAEVFLIEPPRHDGNHRGALPEMRRTGDRLN